LSLAAKLCINCSFQPTFIFAVLLRFVVVAANYRTAALWCWLWENCNSYHHSSCEVIKS